MELEGNGTRFSRQSPRVLLQSELSRDSNVIWPVQSHTRKYSTFAVGQISDLNPPVSPDKRGGSRSSRNVRWDAVDADVLLTNGTEAYGEVVWS